jgi:hypothetical protein
LRTVTLQAAVSYTYTPEGAAMLVVRSDAARAGVLRARSDATTGRRGSMGLSLVA